MSAAAIRACKTDEELFEFLETAHSQCYIAQMDSGGDDWVQQLRKMPAGLRAITVTFELETQLTFGGLGEFFANWLHRDYCKETLLGLRELEAKEAADVFVKAYSLVQPHWDKIDELMDAVPMPAFDDWYQGSELQQALVPLDERMFALRQANGDRGLIEYWLPYARKYPERFGDG
jgi:hypothetical protein